jgi:TonB family protein
MKRLQACASAQNSLTAAVLWMLTTVLVAQETAPGPHARLLVLNSREASRLIVDQVRPEYPPLAKVNYIQGPVRIQLLVTRGGRVAEAHVIRGHPFLAAEALKAVRRWVYRLPKNGSGTAGFLTTVDVNFTLHLHGMVHYPPEPERDLNRQVSPPAVMLKPEWPAAVKRVEVRVLVGADGQVIDSAPVSGPPVDFAAARKNLEHLKFQPARWGNHPVPWYIDLEVPVEGIPAVQHTASPIGSYVHSAPREAFLLQRCA